MRTADSRRGRAISPVLGLAWRFAALGGLTAGLLASPLATSGVPGIAGLAVVAIAAPALAATAPRARPQVGSTEIGADAWAWLAVVALAAAIAGISIGGLRIAAIDAGALETVPGSRVAIRGFVAAVPRRSDGEVDIRVETPAGRLLVRAPEPVPDLDLGGAISARGTIRAPSDFERDYLTRYGIARILDARSIELRNERRGGLVGALDEVRRRAQDALSSGTPVASSNLLRGFVLGQDDRIDAATSDEFKRSGLAHLLAVSGQNVVLLAVLATAGLAAFGVSVRARALSILGLIGVYVLVTGAGPSIQRAGVMGAAASVAALAGRPRSRWYLLLLAAAATLGLDPRASGDIGWQLSFAAVVGILLFSAPLATLIAGPARRRWRRALAEAAALTISATLTTAPLMSLHFGTVSLVSLPANLLAVVAEAPVMWLGMVAAAAGQLPWLPVEPITALAGLLAAYIAQVADWFASPSWAQVELGLDGAAALAGTYALLGGAFALTLTWASRRRSLRPRRRRWAGGVLEGRGRAGLVVVALAAAVLVAAPLGAPRKAGGEASAAPIGLRVSVLDVGEGDAILLDPRAGDPVLVDAGPPEADTAQALTARGVEALSALVVTHTDADHIGGAADVLGALRVSHLLCARIDRPTLGSAELAGTAVDRVAEGSSLRSGGLRLRVVWPPAQLLEPGRRLAEPNALSLVLLARWHGFRMLLTGDAEGELAPVHPGDVDVLEVAHHGSEDTELVARLAATDPELAVISVGADNPYGHPSAPTLVALADAGVPVLRTDLDGDIEIAVNRAGWSAANG